MLSSRISHLDQVDAVVGQPRELVEIVAAVDDSGVQQRGRFARGTHQAEIVTETTNGVNSFMVSAAGFVTP